MIRDIAYSPMAGLPVAAWIGLSAMALFIAAETILAINRFTRLRIPITWHPRLAVVALVIALIHLVLALSAYLSY